MKESFDETASTASNDFPERTDEDVFLAVDAFEFEPDILSVLRNSVSHSAPTSPSSRTSGQVIWTPQLNWTSTLPAYNTVSTLNSVKSVKSFFPDSPKNLVSIKQEWESGSWEDNSPKKASRPSFGFTLRQATYNTLSDLEKFEAAQLEQQASTVGVSTGADCEENWHSSAPTDYKEPMSPTASYIGHAMESITFGALSSWGREAVPPTLSKSPTLLGSICAGPNSPTNSNALSKSLSTAGGIRRVDTAHVIEVSYNAGKPPLLTTAKSLRELRFYLSQVHQVTIPQICLYDCGSQQRFLEEEMDTSPCPTNSILVQVLPTNPLPPGPTYYEHCMVEDYERALAVLPESQADLNATLHYLCIANMKLCGLQQLIDAKADVNSRNSDCPWIRPTCECTPLFHAVCCREYMTMELLLHNNADPDALAFFHISNTELEPLQDQTDAQYSTVYTPLSYAAHHGNRRMMEILLRYGANLYNNRAKCAPLHVVVDRTDYLDGFVSFLCGHGAECEDVVDGENTLMVAMRNRNLHFMEELLQCGANPCRMVNGRSMLHYAVDTGDVSLVELLLRYGACVNVVTDEEKLSPLHLAVEGRSIEEEPEMVRLLMKHGAHVDALDRNFETPLFRALDKYDMKVREILTSAGADTRNKNIDGLSAVDYMLQLPPCPVDIMRAWELTCLTRLK